MKKKIIVSAGTLIILVILYFLIINLSKNNNNADKEKITNEQLKQEKVEIKNDTKVYDVEDVVQKPEQYKGVISVEGKISKIDNQKKVFMLGCEDACVIMPVRYPIEKSNILKDEKNITVIGEIKQENGKYYFAATDFKEK